MTLDPRIPIRRVLPLIKVSFQTFKANRNRTAQRPKNTRWTKDTDESECCRKIEGGKAHRQSLSDDVSRKCGSAAEAIEATTSLLQFMVFLYTVCRLRTDSVRAIAY